jgi:hypothetical protein
MDGMAQMSFALVAVTILLLVSASALLTAVIDQQERERSQAAARLGAMDEVSSQVCQELEFSLYQVALGCISSSYADDEEGFARSYAEAVAQGPAAQFPQVRGPYCIIVNLSSIFLAFQRMPLRDAYPEMALQDGTAQLPVAFVVCGFFVINISCGHDFRERETSLDDGIPVPVPYLRDRAAALSARLEGSNSELELMVRAMLGALVQMRVLRGQGCGQGDSAAEMALTPTDVRNAISLAYLLERSRLLCLPVDGSLLPGSGPLLSEMGTSSRELDPAKMFLSLYGEGDLDLSLVLAQSLYASAEVLALRWLDYFHVIDLLSLGERLADEASLVLADIVDACLGIDLAESTMRSWLGNAFATRGMAEPDYRSFHQASGDLTVSLDEELLLPMENGTMEWMRIEASFTVDLPTVDLLGDDFISSFFEDYRRNTNEMATLLVEMLRALALRIAAHAQLPVIDVSSRPLEAPDLWTATQKKVVEAFASAGDWMSPFLSGPQQHLTDPMARAFLETVVRERLTIFERNDSIDKGMDDLAQQALERLWNDGFPVSLREDGLAMMKSGLASSGGALQEMFSTYDGDVAERIAVFKDVLSRMESGDGMLSGFLDLAAGVISGIPGIEALMESAVLNLLHSTAAAAAVRSANSTYATTTSDAASIRPLVHVVEDPSWVEELAIRIIPPGQSESNTYDTDPLSLEWTPYTSVWEVQVVGSIRFSLMGGGAWIALANGSATCSGEARLDMHLSLAAESGWPLQGVEYHSTRSLLGDLYGLWQKACHWLGEALNWVAGAAGKVVAFMKGLLQRLLSYSVQTVQALTEVLAKAVDGLYSLIQDMASRSVGGVVEGLASIIGSRNCTIDLFGLKVTLSVLPSDLSSSDWRTIVALTLGIPMPKARLSVTVRLVSAASSYHFLGNGTLSAKGWAVQVAIDPLMNLLGHAVTVRGYVGDHGFEVVLPEACRDSVSELRLSSVPGVGAAISNIPLPIPGIKGSFDAGLFVRSSDVASGDLLINEFEQNPSGTDADHEWVEVLNPSATSISTVGYQLRTQHGQQALERLGSGVIAARSRQVYQLEGQCLDNEGEAQFPRMESVSLLAPDGRVVDRTPWVQDTRDDGRTWQREFDGAGRWVFAPSTRGKANGGVIGQAMGIAQVRQALDNISSTLVQPSSHDPVGSIRTLVLRAVSSLLSNLEKGTVLEAGVFLEVGVAAVTGTASAMLRVSLSVSGDLIRALRQWVERVIDQLLSRFCVEGIGVPFDAKSLLEQSWLRGSVVLQAGVPRFLGLSAAKVRVGFEVGCNLACISAALGHDSGIGRIEGNCRLYGVSSMFLPSQLRSSGVTSDLYLFRFALWDR